MIYSTDDHFIYLKGMFPREVMVDQLNATWSKTKGWRLPKNLHVYRELYLNLPVLRENNEFVEDGKQARHAQDYWLDQKRLFKLSDPRLREYQKFDAAYIEARKNCLVLNEPRTGKTPTMIIVTKNLGTKKNMIVCPSSLVFNWEKEIKTWFPEAWTFPVSGTPKKRGTIYENFAKCSRLQPTFLIISKDTWKIDSNTNSKVDYPIGKVEFDTVIVDEAHFLRNYKTAQSKAIFDIKAQNKYALTGTPAVKHAVDVYGLLKFINPKAFPSYWQFADRYFHIIEDNWGKKIGESKPRREKELKELMEVNSVQRKRKEVMKWLPATQHQTLPVKMEGKQLKLYDQMMDTFMATDEESEHEVDTMNKLTQLLRLRQLCIDPRLVGFENVVGAKTTALLEFAEDNRDPFIVMTTFSSYFKIIKPELEKLGKKVGVIDGSTSKIQKHKTAEGFQRGEFDILLCNIIAAGTGFTLDRADTILFLDKDFNPANNEQAQDRIVPTTESRYHPINVISLVCGGSIDERVNDIIDQKLDLTKIINNPKELIGSAG